VGPKTLGWEHSKRILKMFFKNLGVVFYSTKMFSENGFVQMELELEKKELVVL
jgi:hypothetical protein